MIVKPFILFCRDMNLLTPAILFIITNLYRKFNIYMHSMVKFIRDTLIKGVAVDSPAREYVTERGQNRLNQRIPRI